MHQSTSYSTLEVSAPDPEFHQKEVVSYPEHSYPEAVPVEHHAAASTTYSSESGKEVIYVPDHGYYKPDGSPYSQNAAYAGAYDPRTGSSAGTPHPYAAAGLSPMTGAPTEQGDQYSQNAAPNEKTPKATICGLPKRTFYIVLAVAIVVVIAAIAGGVAGGIAASRSSSDSDSSSSSSPSDGSSSGSTTDGPKILSNSKLTATNWTDSEGTVYRTIFFQDAYNAIIARRWDSKGSAWTTDNLTDMYVATTRPLDPGPGTPLAAASIDRDDRYETHLWFLTEKNIIRSMAATDALNSPSQWTNDTLDDAVLETWNGGQLAAMWQRCWRDDCDGAWIVAYQRPEGAIKTANSTTWATATVAVESSNVAANSSLAIIPQLNGGRLDRLELVSEDVSSSSAGTMSVTTYNDTWTASDDRVTELLTNIPQPNSRQQFAVTKWDSWNQALYLALLEDGKVQGTHWDGSNMNALTSIEFNQGPEVNFTSIAMTTDAMFYGISNDEILEYTVDQTNPSTLNYVGTVYP